MRKVFRAVSPVVLAGVILVTLAFATYGRSLHVPFFFDDLQGILENRTIRNLGDLPAVLSPPRNGSGVTGRPLVNLSLALNYALGGTNVVGYHLANLVLHAAAGLLLFGCVRRTLLAAPGQERFRPHALIFGFCTAALWVVHPLQTESVICVIQRTEVLVGLFYLLTLYGFIRAVEAGSRAWSALAVGSCFLGMASKEVMVSAPVLIFLYDRTFVAGSFAKAWAARRGLHLAIASAWVLLALLVLRFGGNRGEVAGFGVGAAWWPYALKQCEAILLYLKLTLWPHPLVVFYGIDVVTDPLDVWPQILGLAGLLGGAGYALWRRPALGFCAAWFFAILAPSSSIVPLASQTVSEHRMYLPLAAPLVLAMAGLFTCCSRSVVWWVISCTAAGVMISFRRSVDYRSDLSIWADTVAKVPHNVRARVNLGLAYVAAGQPALALNEYRTALQLDPNSHHTLSNFASLLLELGRYAEAMELSRTALRLQPDFAQAHNNLGAALLKTGQFAESIVHLEAALRLSPALSEAHCNLSAALIQQGKADPAIVHAEAAIRLNPNYPLAHFNLSNAFLLKNQREQAARELHTAVRLKPDFAEAHSSLGAIYFEWGNLERAIFHFQSAVQAAPGFVAARSNLAAAFLQVGRSAEAIEQLRAIVALQPDNTDAHSGLGNLLARLGRNVEAVAAFSEVLRVRPGDPHAKSEIDRLRALPSAPRE